MTAFRPVPASLIAAFALLISAPTQAVGAPSPTRTDLPSESVYHLDAALVDQDGQALRCASASNKPRLVSMFYTSCKFVCALIIDTLPKTEHELAQADCARI